MKNGPNGPRLVEVLVKNRSNGPILVEVLGKYRDNQHMLLSMLPFLRVTLGAFYIDPELLLKHSTFALFHST